jgi:hypothetical protein
VLKNAKVKVILNEIMQRNNGESGQLYKITELSLLPRKLFHFFFRVQVDQGFVSGVLVDAGSDSSTFVPGQLLGLSDPEDPIRFIPGQMEDGSFVPGQNTKGVFHPGKKLYKN